MRIQTQRETFAWRLAVQVPPSHVQYTHTIFPEDDPDMRGGEVKAWDHSSGSPRSVGHLGWEADGNIGMVEVHPDYRRKGIATEMLNRARAVYPEVRVHTPEEMDEWGDTDEGVAWQNAIAKRGSRWFCAVEDWDHQGARAVHHIPTDEAWNYRLFTPGQDFGGDEMFDPEWLKQDVAKSGVRSPLKIITDGPRAHVDDGNHRLQAAMQAGLPTVPTHVMVVPPQEYENYWENNAQSRDEGLAGSHKSGPSLSRLLSGWQAAGGRVKD